MTEPAREIYELRIADVERGEQSARNVVEGVANVLLGPLGRRFEDIAGTVEVHIVERRTGKVVVSMKASDDARGVANLVSADLDRLDADAFAIEWGIGEPGPASTS